MNNNNSFSIGIKLLVLLLSILTVLLSLPFSAFAENDANYYSDMASVAVNKETNKDTDADAGAYIVIFTRPDINMD